MNNTLDRTKAPDFNLIDKINIIKAQSATLDNGIPVYSINAGTQDLVKIDFIFDAGSWLQDKNLVSSTTNAMLLEGTTNLSSQQIAEKLDFYGAFLQNEANKHSATLTLYVLNKYLSEGLEIVADVLKNSIFPEKDMKTFLQNKYQDFVINNQKNDKIARKYFNEMLFGKNHPYGRNYNNSDFQNVTVEDLKTFYKKYYSSNNCKIIISGKIDDLHYKELNNFFGKYDWKSESKTEERKYLITPTENKKFVEDKENAFQTALRLGKITVNMKDDDYLGLQVVNTILGGYFGSRLMANIREDKGYTYGIGSGLVSMATTGYFIIVSEVKKEMREKAVIEIYKEIDILKTTLVPAHELQIVKNYLMGEVLRGFDGAFSLSAAFRSLMENNLDYVYYEKLISTIKNITSEEIKQLTIKHLQTDSLYEVMVG